MSRITKGANAPKTKKPAKADLADAALVADVERAIREALAIPLTKLPKAQLSARGLADLERKLEGRGLERAIGARSGEVLRVPLEAQLLARVEGGGHLPLKGALNRIKGASISVIKAEIDRLVKAGKLHLVLRTEEPVVVGAEERVLAKAELARLAKWLDESASLLKKVSKKRMTLLYSDLPALPDGIDLPGMRRPPPPLAPPPPEVMEAALRRLEEPRLKLVRIPDLVRALEGQFSRTGIHDALTKAEKRGVLELHPDAGSEFLKPEDAALCPPGPPGTVFSYARLLSS